MLFTFTFSIDMLQEEEECEDVSGVIGGVSEEEEEECSGEEMSVIGSEMDTGSVTYGGTEKYDEEFDIEAEKQQ